MGGCLMTMNVSLMYVPFLWRTYVELILISQHSLYGISTVQAYAYASYGQGDSISLRALVAAVWYVIEIFLTPRIRTGTRRALETLHTVGVLHMIYFYSIEGFGDYGRTGVVSW